ncbi:MAG: hypothetical protein AAFR81_21120 [Chloroflexota bacterium]
MTTENLLATIYQNGIMMRQRFVRTFVATLVLIGGLALTANVEAIPFQVFGFLLVFMLATGIMSILSLLRVLFTGRTQLDISADGVTHKVLGALLIPRTQTTSYTWDEIQDIDVQAGRATDKTPTYVEGSSMIAGTYKLLIGDPEIATVTVKTPSKTITLKEASGDLDFVLLQVPKMLAEKRTSAIIASLEAGNSTTVHDLILTADGIRLGERLISWDNITYTMYKRLGGIQYVIRQRADNEKLTTLQTGDGQVFVGVLAHFDPR